MRGIVGATLLISIVRPLSAENPISLEQLLIEASERNPEIQAAYRSWKVADKEADTASIWPNPMLKYVREKDPIGEEGMDPMERRHYSVEQEIPFPGKLSNEARMMRHEAMIKEAAYHEKRLEVLKKAKQLFYRLAWADRLAELAKQTAGTFRLVSKSAESMLAGEKIPATDVFMIHAELETMENMVFEKKQERRLIEIELNALLDRSSETIWGTATSKHLSDIPYDVAELESLAQQHSPVYLASRHEINHSQAMRSRNRLEFAPDFGLMYEYQTAGAGSGVGPSGRAVGVSLSVPLWFRRPIAKAIAGSEHLLEAEAQSARMGAMVRRMIQMERTETITHMILAKNIEKKILPSAVAAKNTARDRYVSGRGDVMRFMEATRLWLKTHETHEDQLYHFAEHWAELEQWVGTDLIAPAPEESHGK
ncbi:MAG: hypothetical protein KCHDKBKB_02342 [Elusimicrobia bacterium]|nr:hypothetical protein [Elusimicrobiota bacterium]